MDYVDIVVKESPGLCRCCLSEGCYKDLATEYPWMDETEVYADMLFECFDISISQHPTGPNGSKRLICEVCITRLRDACNFKKQVQDSERKFVDMLARGDFENKERETLEFEEDMPMKSEMIVEEEPIEAEYLEDMDDFDEDDLPLSSTKIQQPTTSKAAEPVVKKGKRAATKKPTGVKPEKKPKLAMKKVPVSKQAKGTTIPVYKKRWRNLDIILKNTTVVPFKWWQKLKCYYCGDLSHSDYDDFVEHTRAHTDDDKPLMSTNAKLTEVKLDVSDITCKICNESFVTVHKIISHLLVKHKLPYDRNVELDIFAFKLKPIKCVDCHAQFPKVAALIAHVYADHPHNVYPCEKCDKNFNSLKDLKGHNRSHHLTILYPCGFCNVTFTTRAALQKHNTAEHVSVCNLCELTFKNLKEKLEHMKTHDLITATAIECQLCSFMFKRRCDFLRHAENCNLEKKHYQPIEINMNRREGGRLKRKMLDPTAPKTDERTSYRQRRHNLNCILNMSTAIPFTYYYNSFKCIFCVENFYDTEELLEHTVRDHIKALAKDCFQPRVQMSHLKVDVKNLACKVCFQEMPDFETWVDHVNTEHDAEYDKTVKFEVMPFKLVQDNYPCLNCDKVFQYFNVLIQHNRHEHCPNTFVCPYCGKMTYNKSSLDTHIYNAHKDYGHTCPKCNGRYLDFERFQTHVCKKKRAKPPKCESCNEVFTSRYYLKRHLIDVHGSGHPCPYCDRLFTRLSLMKEHENRQHTRAISYDCTTCGAKFYRKRILQEHVANMHNGVRKYICNICRQGYTTSKELRRHVKKLHANASPVRVRKASFDLL